MENIILTTENGDSFSVDVVRYFENAGKKYLIFTTNEKDEQGYIKLYAVRVDNTGEAGGMAEASNIADENEWTTVKTVIQTIISNIRNNIPVTSDLNLNAITHLKATSSRVFRLQESSTKILASKKEVPAASPVPEIHRMPEPVPEVTVEVAKEASLPPAEPMKTVEESGPLNYKQLYEDAMREVEKLTSANLLYRAKLEAFRELLDQE